MRATNANDVAAEPIRCESSGARRHAISGSLLLALACLTLACGDGQGAPDANGEAGKRAIAVPGGRHSDVVTLTAESVEANSIRIEKAQRRELRPAFRAPAHVAFDKEGMAHVGSPVKGRVSEMRARLGDEVERGDILLVLESPELGEAQSDYLQKRSVAKTSLPPVDLARSAHERARGLYDRTQGISLAEVEKREAEFHAAQAALQAAKTAELASENRLHLLGMEQSAVQRLGETGEIDPHFSVRAPIRGLVIEREVTLGELVNPDREALLVLADVSKLWVLADVPETRLRETAVGARARVLLGMEQEHWCEGVVAFVSPSVDPNTRSVHVRIDVADRHPELRPGAFAQAEIVADAGNMAKDSLQLAVCESAVQTLGGEPVVFVPVAGSAGTFAKRVVRIGAATGGMVPVFSGLQEGEACVTAGSFVLKAEFIKTGAVQED